MIPFCIILFVAVIAIIAVWNGVADFKTAYFQSCVLLVNVNWFDGIVIDELWVRNSKIWRIKGMEDMLFAKPIGFMLKKTNSWHDHVLHHLAHNRGHRGTYRQNLIKNTL